MRRLAGILATVALLGACNESPEPQATRTVSHPQGWAIDVPTETTAVETDTGFDIQRPGYPHLRSPATIAVRLVVEATTDLPDHRVLDGIEVRYGIEIHGGGSGGTEYGFHAERPFCGAILSVRQVIQREFGGTPTFDQAWAVIASADCLSEP